jgi:hypothetical protein
MRLRWNVVAPWMAPGLLCGIALAQLLFAHFSSLSPWKGGGFGMFSTVDSPGARFLRIYLVTPQGNLPVTIPDTLKDKEVELRTLATQQLADEFAMALAKGTWVKLRMASAVPYYLQLLKVNAQDSAQDRLMADLATNSQYVNNEITFDKFNFVRMLKYDESPDTINTKIDLNSVRIEIWKYSFNKDSVSLLAKKFIQATSTLSR